MSLNSSKHGEEPLGSSPSSSSSSFPSSASSSSSTRLSLEDLFRTATESSKSWFDMMREEELEVERIQEEERRDRGRKIFVGGFDFEGLSSEQERLIRLEVLLGCFSTFGTVIRTKVNLEKLFAFVVFSDSFAAQRAVDQLSDHKTRARLLAFASYNLELDGLPRHLAPKSNFYARWPRKTSQGKKEKAFREEKRLRTLDRSSKKASKPQPPPSNLSSTTSSAPSMTSNATTSSESTPQQSDTTGCLCVSAPSSSSKGEKKERKPRHDKIPPSLASSPRKSQQDIGEEGDVKQPKQKKRNHGRRKRKPLNSDQPTHQQQSAPHLETVEQGRPQLDSQQPSQRKSQFILAA